MFNCRLGRLLLVSVGGEFGCGCLRGYGCDVVGVRGATGYYNYATYTDVYGRGTVAVRPSTLNFLCPIMSRGGYASYNLYRGMYTFGGGCSEDRGLPRPVTCTTQRGSVRRIRADHDNTTFVTVSS